MISSATEASAFFDAYRAAFERMDVAAVLQHFAFPCHVATDTGDAVHLTVAGESDWRVQVERLLEMYRSLGFHSARFRRIATTPVSSRLLQVLVQWELVNPAGDLIHDFTASYTLADRENRLRIVAIAHDEVARVRTSAPRRTVEDFR